MIQVPMQVFQELMLDFSGTSGNYKATCYCNPAMHPHRLRLRYFGLKKLIEAARHIRVMAVHQTVLIFTGGGNIMPDPENVDATGVGPVNGVEPEPEPKDDDTQEILVKDPIEIPQPE